MEKPTTEEVGRALRDGPAPADDDPGAEADVEVEGRRREAQDFLGGGAGGGVVGVTGVDVVVVVDVEGTS